MDDLTPNPPAPTGIRSLRPRAFALWRFKLLLGAAVLVWSTVPYLVLQHVRLRPPFQMPLTAFDRAVGFEPGWVAVYLSLYALAVLAGLFYTDPGGLRRYALAVVLADLVAYLIFLTWPTCVARPPAAADANWLYRVLITVDRPCNACPSLHAAVAVIAAHALGRLFRDAPMRPAVRAGLWLLGWGWSVAIVYAALATRQHVVIDLAAGAVLGWVAWVAAGAVGAGGRVRST